MDIKQVAAEAKQHLYALVTQWLKGELRGRNFLAYDPTYDDKKLGSFQINIDTGVWKNFSNGQCGNDAVSLYHYINSCTMREAADAVARQIGAVDFKPKPAPPKTGGDWVPEELAPSDPRPENLKRWERDANNQLIGIEPNRYWIYRNAEGRAIYATARFEYADGTKDVKPYCFCKNSESGLRKWRPKGYPEPRPLYGLDRVAKPTAKMILVVEGEKCADAAQALLGDTWAVVAWCGGGKAVGKANWSPIKGRKRIVWPDNDKPGFITARDLIALEPIDNTRVVNPPLDAPKAWDVADAIEKDGWTRERLIDALKASIPAAEFMYIEPEIRFPDTLPAAQATAPIQESMPALYEAAPIAVDAIPMPPDLPEPPPAEYDDVDMDGPDCPFRILGYNRSTYYFYSYSTRQLVELSPSEITDSNALRLATLQWWERSFPGKNGMDIKSARNALVQIAHSKGVFDPDIIRGPGAWVDGDSIVVHQGDHLLVDGRRTLLSDFRSRFIYEADIANGADDHEPPLPVQEANKIMQIMDSLSWERKEYGRYLAGWVVCALISGTLSWRPHVFVTGGAGTGKSYVMNHIVRKLLGRSVTQLMGDSSAAGMRQALENRAWPVWVDEFEGESSDQLRNIEAVLSLLRCASSDTDAAIVKGSKDGIARKYKIRCCAIMSAIGVNIVKHADVTRFAVLTLRKFQGTEEEQMRHFEELDKFVHVTMTPEWCAGFRARAISMAKTIRENAKIFSRAAGEILGARLGDQIGALLAGAYSCHSNGIISMEDARGWIEKQDWSEHSDTKGDTDDIKCLKTILMQVVQAPAGKGIANRSISELLRLCGSDPRTDFFADSPDVSPRDARDTLERIGIRRDKDGIAISCVSREIGRILRGTPWEIEWGSQLRRIKGASYQKPRFVGIPQKAVHIPITIIDLGESHG